MSFLQRAPISPRGRRGRRRLAVPVTAMALLGVVCVPVAAPAAAAPAAPADGSAMRTGVLAIAGAISAVGQTPELATPLPFASASVAQLLDLDANLAKGVERALENGGTDLAAALDSIDGVDVAPGATTRSLSFTYDRTVTADLDLAHDDGDLRVGGQGAGGRVSVSLTTQDAHPFVVSIDPDQPDPLLRTALVSQPVMDLSVTVDTDGIRDLDARQGFTRLDVTDGHYRIDRDQTITMRDPDGRSLLTIEDLRYSTLPDLFRIVTGTDDLDIELDLALPGSLAGGEGDERTGTLALEGVPTGVVWPDADDAVRDYGSALAQATSLSMVDGMTSLAQYTGTVLSLQDAADVDFPNLQGGTTDLFAPGDDLLDLVATSAAAQVVCGAAPQSPPAGVAAPGDTTYCQATTADGLGTPSAITWTLHDGGTIASSPDDALGADPAGFVKIENGDGEPDLEVSFTADEEPLTGRTVPRTVQDVVSRIDELEGSSASASLTEGRLDVALSIVRARNTESLELGNPSTLGTLVGLTGLRSEDPDHPATAPATATGASFDVGFGIQTGPLGEGEARETVLLPHDESLLVVEGLSADAPTTVTGLPARIGFLGVTTDLTELSLGTAGSANAVELDRVVGSGQSATDPLPLGDLVSEDGAVDTDQLDLRSAVTGSIAFEATEKPLPGGAHAVGTPSDPAHGTAKVSWSARSVPRVALDAGYERLRVFDPVPAAFLTGTARVTSTGDVESVSVDVTSLEQGTTLYDVLGVAAGTDPVGVARRLVGDGVACQNVTILDADTLTCGELAPSGRAVWADGQSVDTIVLGSPFVMRDAVIGGLASTLAKFDQLTGDNRTGADDLPADQYASTLPLVDLKPAQLAVERETLRTGLGGLTQAAAADEGGTGGADLPSVSSVQELSGAVDTLFAADSGHRPTIDFDLGAEALAVELSVQAPEGTVLRAALRLDDAGSPTQPGRGQVMSGRVEDEQRTVPVDVESTTTLALAVDRATARTTVTAPTGTSSSAVVGRTGAQLAGHPLQAGVSALEVLKQDSSVTPTQDSSAALGVDVSTSYDAAGDGVLRTTRTNARSSGRAAEARLVVGPGDLISYDADATDTSGGEGTAQPAPDPMQVGFLAEGLDGLAAAIGSAQDGAAPRNLDPQTRVPVSAPLIGTDLDAGAGVPDTLTSLTSALRTELAAPAVADAEDAAELEGVLDDAVSDAIAATDGIAPVAAGDVAVEVTCGGLAGACSPCPAVDPQDPDPAACTTDSSTGWKTVEVSFLLDGVEAEGEVAFETGLAGLEVRSDKKIETTTTWQLPVTLRLVRGVGPQVVVGPDEALETHVSARLPDDGIDAIVGYLPAHLDAEDEADRSVDTVIRIAPEPGDYDLFELYDGELKARPSFADPAAGTEEGLTLGFATLDQPGLLGLEGTLGLPWTPADGFGEVTYDEVTLDVGDVIAGLATPFAVLDPYLAPVRDVVDVMRSPIPVISDLSELAGGDEVSLLSLLETAAQATRKPQLELAHRVIGLTGGVTDMVTAAKALAKGKVPLEELEDVGALLTVEPGDVSLLESCTQTVRPAGGKAGAPQPCEDEEGDEGAGGVAGQSTAEKRTGNRNAKKTVDERTGEVTAQLPGFSLPFLADTDQVLDLLTGEGEASYFRLDLGTLAASVSYSRKFGPIMAGPVPIVPFVGGSISIEGRLAMGFDSLPQTLAAESVAPGDVDALVAKYDKFDGGDVIREGFYVDDLDAEGEDVPEVKLVTTIEAGAGVSIGIVTAGLKGGVTLTINLDLNDPNDDGRLRTAEIRQMFNGDASCIFDASATIEAFISVFVEIELLFTSLEYEFDLLRLGPYELFKYGCPDVVPTLVTANGDGSELRLTSGSRSGQRMPGGADGVDEYEVRQYDRAGVTTYEISGYGRVQNVTVTRSGGTWTTRIFQSGVNLPGQDVLQTLHSGTRPTFVADGGAGDDTLSFLAGEDFADDGSGGVKLETTPFDTRVTALTGGTGNDVLETGDADDTGVDGGSGNDSISLGLGDDRATGGSGDDVVDGGAGRDDLRGGSGNDRISGGAGADRLLGEDGQDNLVGGPGRDVRALLVRPRGSGANVVSDQVRLGFDSGDVIVGGAGADSVDGGDGSDVVVGGDAPSLSNPAVGTVFRTGSRSVSVLRQGAADDDPNEFTTESVPVDTATVPTAQELDTLCTSGAPESATGSADYVTGGPEADVVVGGNGPDSLDGGAGPDEICGRAGNDSISGDGAGAADAAADPALDSDVVRGGTGDDRVDAGRGDDVVLGDDADLYRSGGGRWLDGSLRGTGRGHGDDYLAGGEGADVLAGGDGADLVVGGVGDDATYGEGRDTAAVGGAAPAVSERLLDCNPATRVVAGRIDLNGDLLAGPADVANGIAADTGQLAGMDVVDGVLRDPATGATLNGLLDGDLVVVGGRVDLDRDGVVGSDRDDTGSIALPSMLDTGANEDGDCVLSGDGDDELRGGTGSDYLGAGDGADLADGGDGNDLVLGDAGTDVLLGGPHHDVLVGGTGDDHLVGGNGDDRLRGNEGADDLVGGSETPGAADGQDVLLGGRDQDVLVAENGVLVSDDIVSASGATSWADVEIVPAAVRGDDPDLVFASSALTCGDAPTTRYLTVVADDGVAGVPVASPGTPLAYDELYGGFGCDVVLGSPGDDLVRGGQDSDVVEGGPGADLGYGDDGDDVVVGGSTFDPTATRTRYTVERTGASVPDAADRLFGDGGPDAIDGTDLVAGDNALPIRVPALAVPGVRTAYTLRLDNVATVASGPATIGAGDVISGGGRRDLIFGQAGADTIEGDAGDDYVEGNDGADDLRGGADDDDLVGGSSTADGLPLGVTGLRLARAGGAVPAGAPRLLDGSDRISGGADDDVVLGDNGLLTRPADAPATRTDGTTLRTIRLDDVVTATRPTAVPAGVGAADVLLGDAGRDLAFGQAGNDALGGGAGDDYLEGNVGDDDLAGGDGEDDLVGGGSSQGVVIGVSQGTVVDRLLTAPTSTTDTSAAGLVDGQDRLDGGSARDVLLGDSGRITRNGPNRTVLGGASGPQVARQVAMADERPGVWAGSDQLFGGSGDDDLYGQLDGTLSTRTQLTYGGERVRGDILDGGAGDDALLGDQGVSVPTPAAALGEVDRTVADSSRFLRELIRPRGTLVRVVTQTQSTTGGDDLLLGGTGADSVHAGAGRDLVNAGAGDDVVYGGDGSDALWGGADHDLLFGGAGDDALDLKRRGTDVKLWRLVAPTEDTDAVRKTLNGRDVLYGGAGADAMQADQGDSGTTRVIQGDRLIDWLARTNYQKVCVQGSGAGKVRSASTASL